jgi:hypothetical protein
MSEATLTPFESKQVSSHGAQSLSNGNMPLERKISLKAKPIGSRSPTASQVGFFGALS